MALRMTAAPSPWAANLGARRGPGRLAVAGTHPVRTRTAALRYWMTMPPSIMSNWPVM